MGKPGVPKVVTWTSMFPWSVESLTPRECLALSVLAHGLAFAQWKRGLPVLVSVSSVGSAGRAHTGPGAGASLDPRALTCPVRL